ncbi:MAG: prepilin-type N-terminal cleavage/methylation domain-containing protein [Atopobiaceae bacterium]|nr:prepilin-type N-terminal cleavage/methylation domain-containing protein [Atopobiaceae bacterium]
MKDYLEKRREELSKRDGGFTLMEMLIVVAIIAVLIAIAIPVFTSQLEKSREATDKANLRSAYAEQMAALVSWDGKSELAPVKVKAQQAQANWQSDGDAASIKIADGITDAKGNASGVDVTAKVSPDGEWQVKADTTNMKITIE